VDLFEELAQRTAAAGRSELPALLGRLVELEAHVRLRLAEAPAAGAPIASRVIDADEAARIAGTSKRWLLAHTRGLKFRRDLSRKQPRFDEGGLRAWFASRRAR
jgi:hypothetical protein